MTSLYYIERNVAVVFVVFINLLYKHTVHFIRRFPVISRRTLLLFIRYNVVIKNKGISQYTFMPALASRL